MLPGFPVRKFSLSTLFLLSLVGLLTGSSLLMGQISPGITISAAVTTILAALLVLAVVLVDRGNFFGTFLTSRPEKALWIIALSLFALGALRFHGLATLQHLFSALVFLFGLVVASQSTCLRWRQLARNVLRLAAVFSSALAGVIFISASPILDARSMAMILCLNVAILLPAVRESKWWWFAVVPPPLAIVLSESRTASAVVVLLVTLFFWLGPGQRLVRFLRSGLAFFASALLTAMAHWAWPPMRERWTFFGDRGVELILGTGNSGETVIVNTNGRVLFWSELVDTLKTPWDVVFGRGLGFGAEFGKALYPCCFPTPLNEYLRILVDTGVIGLLVTGGLILLIWIRLYGGREQNDAIVGLLALVSALGLAVTESPFIYPFYLFPLTLLIGMGLGASGVSVRFPLSKSRNPLTRKE